MTAIRHPLITVSALVPKVQRRFPSAIQRWNGWAALQDRSYSSGMLSRKNARLLHAALAKCHTPSDWFDFASLAFPAHQRKQEILGFLELAAARNPKVVMEIGTAQSGTQYLLGQVLESADLIMAVDLCVRNLRLLEAFSRPGLNRIHVGGSSYGTSTVKRVKESLAGRLIDVLFIDGDHTYDGVKADYEIYAPLVRAGGLIAFHDIVEDHQTRHGRSSGGWAGEVPRYWREICKGRKTWAFIGDPDQDGMGIGVLEQSAAWPGRI